jgi:hypothetical protein
LKNVYQIGFFFCYIVYKFKIKPYQTKPQLCDLSVYWNLHYSLKIREKMNLEKGEF